MFLTPEMYSSCVTINQDVGEASLTLGSTILRNDRGGAKLPSTDVPAFFGDKETIGVYSGTKNVGARNATTSYYTVKKQPRLLLLTPQTIMDLYERVKSKEDQLTIVAYIDPPVNEKTTYSPSFDQEKDGVVQPMGFLTQKDLYEYKEKGQGLYINRRMANIVCSVGYDGWLVMPGALYQYVPSRNAVTPYPPEIMLCKWNNVLDKALQNIV